MTRYRLYQDREGYWVVMKYEHACETCWGFYSSAEGARAALLEIGVTPEETE